MCLTYQHNVVVSMFENQVKFVDFLAERFNVEMLQRTEQDEIQCDLHDESFFFFSSLLGFFYYFTPAQSIFKITQNANNIRVTRRGKKRHVLFFAN